MESFAIQVVRRFLPQALLRLNGVWIVLLSGYFALAGRTTASGAELSYARDVRPILAAKCFACHGPAEDSREADLRLDNLAGATADLGGHQAVKPGDPSNSELLARVQSDDPDLRMPPPATNKTLKPEEIAILKQWIEQGAKYEQHWAFVKPQRPAIPAVKATQWPVNPIDNFVLARLEQEGLQPSPAAEPYLLIRRLYLDLIGLPPTIAEADDWHAQLTQDVPAGAINEVAYEKLVEHLLQSPNYGERWARRWLDLARYADTNGYEKDRPRSIWPYRDWVIRALNDDLPFDQFTIKQLAGDMLPDPSQDDLIATGFHRNTMLNEEGGIDPLEFRFYSMTDRVATTGTTWLALTMGCVQCHSHKYDPITHTEYYQFLALMNNADELDRNLTNPEQAKHRAEQLAQADKMLAELPEHWPVAKSDDQTLEATFAQWLKDERETATNWTALRPTEATSNLPLLTIRDDDSIFASGDITKDDTYTLKFRNLPQNVTAILLEALPDEDLPAGGPGMTYYEGPKGDFFLGEFQASLGQQKLAFAGATEDYAKNHFGNQDASAALALDGDPQTGWSCAARMGEPHQAVFVLEKPLAANANEELTISLRFGRHYACSLGHFRLSVTADTKNVIARQRPKSIDDLLVLPDEKLAPEQRQMLRDYFLLHAPQVSKQADQIHALRKEPNSTTTLIFRERPANHPRATHVHHRGEFLQAKEIVRPDVPAFLPSLPEGKHDRLALAQWLVSPEHPLTARVVANRQWEAFFSKGLVATSGDFGFQGDFPSHPQLLDWLACELVQPTCGEPAAAWSIKHLQRLIVTSATYQQSARVGEELLAKDPANRLLARAGRLRLEAELIRDSALQASGRLSPKMFGPPVYPPQPAGALDTAYGGAKWNESQGEDRYRRGIYTFMKRTAPYAMFNTFDAPSGETCIARRDVSNSPLQALTLLNDDVFADTAQALGKTAADAPGGDAERATLVFRRCLTRPPQAAELQRLMEFVKQQRERLAGGQIDPKALAADPAGNAQEQALWTICARAIMNLDEFVTRN